MKQTTLAFSLAVLLLIAGCNTITHNKVGDNTPASTPDRTPTRNPGEQSPEQSTTTVTPAEDGTNETVWVDEPITRPLDEFPQYRAPENNYTLRYAYLLTNPVDMDELTRYSYPPDPDLQDGALRNVTRFDWEQVNEDTTRLNIGVDIPRQQYTNSVLGRVFMRYAHVLNQSIQEDNEWNIDEIHLEVSVDGEPVRSNHIDAADALSWIRYRDGPDRNISTKLSRHLFASSVYQTGVDVPATVPTRDLSGDDSPGVDAPQYRRAIDAETGDGITLQRAQRHGQVLYVDYVSDANPSNRSRRLGEVTAVALGYGRAIENGAPRTDYVLITEKIRRENGTLDTRGYVRVGGPWARAAYTGDTPLTEFVSIVRNRYYPEGNDLNT